MAGAARGAELKGAIMLSLDYVKGQYRFHLRYEAGQEPIVLDTLVEMVARRDLSFDWYDAAVMSHQLGQHLAKELKNLAPKKPE